MESTSALVCREKDAQSAWLWSGALLLGILFLGVQGIGMAGESRTSFAVMVSVQPTATLREISRPATIDISSADVQRGFAEIDPVRFEVASNSRDGYALELMPVSRLFTAVSVQGLGDDVTVGADGGTVIQRRRNAQPAPLNLRFKFFLRADLAPGRYPWPLALTARAL